MALTAEQLRKRLEDRGYLSLNQFVAYLRVYAPQAYVSYPTALGLIREGKIAAVQVGNAYRIRRVEVERWVIQGNREGVQLGG